ncbi:hypothetical protein EIP86_000275 [Pleurotus ostreatoroseus]|nr:hypothetical protein EIP86_000275 [Pleurotus ostreatoroseus]
MPSPFDIRKQAITRILLRSFEVLASRLPVPDFIPPVHYEINEYLIFDLKLPAIWAASYLLYYFILDPVAAILYIPISALTLLTATAVSHRPDAMTIGGVMHAVCWIAQFIGHGVAEKRAPALLDNLLGAPFFAHLEILFSLGYRPQLHHDLKNSVGVEIARVKKLQADKKRAAAKKAT